MTRNDIINRLPMVAFDIVKLDRTPFQPASDVPSPIFCRFRARAIINSNLLEGFSREFKAWIMPGDSEPNLNQKEWSLMAEEALRDLRIEVPPRLHLRTHLDDLLGSDEEYA